MCFIDMSESPLTRLYPASEPERQLIRNELGELLKSVHFVNSKRYPALLLYVVEEALAGRSDELKERMLGTEVFHRRADYDSSNDTVVRVAAGEVRKRLALVYHESSVEHQVHITLPTGSYVPEFYRTTSQEEPSIPVGAASERQIAPVVFEEPAPPSASTPILGTLWRKPFVWLGMVVLAACSIGLFVNLRAASRRTSIERFWQPIQASSNSAIICPGAVVLSAGTSSGMTVATRTDDYPFTSLATTLAVADVVDLFSMNHIGFAVQPASSTNLTDIREHPVILIGAYTNEWTNRIQSELRYRFAPEPAKQIYDAVNPSTRWMRPSSLPLNEEDDFAIVGRFHSNLTDNQVVLIAGIGKNGTQAAAQFVTTPQYMDLLNQRSGDWASKNVEVVLKVKVIDGQDGVISVEAVHVW